MVKTDLVDFSQELRSRLVYVGWHPAYYGWQMVFDFGWTRVSIALTPFTQGVEMFAWGLFYRPIRNLTPEVAARVLRKILERSKR
jgi:hypothetical protein